MTEEKVITVKSEEFNIPNNSCWWRMKEQAWCGDDNVNLYTNYCDHVNNDDTEEPTRCMKQFCPFLQ
jgi:hypothetical protein